MGQAETPPSMGEIALEMISIAMVNYYPSVSSALRSR